MNYVIAFGLGSLVVLVARLAYLGWQWWHTTLDVRESERRIAELTEKRAAIQRQLDWIERKDLDA